MQRVTHAAEPAKSMQPICDFIGLPVLKHDFKHVEYDVAEFDRCADMPGLHTMRGKVEAMLRKTLPSDPFQRFANAAFWREPQRIPEGLRIV